MNRYEEYQETGFEWLGKIPSNWGLSRVGKFFTERSEKVDDVTYPPLSVTMSGIVDQLSDVAKTNDGGNRKLVKKHDFVINSRSDRKGSSGISPRDGSVSLINIVLEPRELDPQFIQYLFKNYYFKEEYFRNGKGIHWDLWTTRWDQLKNIKFPIPSNNEQQLISRYLDKKTQQIDSLVKKIQKKIELLKEQRTSLINQCVTKGLDPNVEMKDSGVEWIGEIPKHWEVVSLKSCSNIFRGKFSHRPRNDPEFYDGDYPFIQTGDITRSGKYITDYTQSLNEKGFSVSKEFPVDTLIMGISANIGNVSILKIQSCFPDSIVGFYPKENSSTEFLYFMFSSMKEEFERNSIVSTQLNLNVDRLGDIKIPLIPIYEQQQISQYLDLKLTEIDKLIGIHTSQCDLIFEYRQSLISSVVTGKVRVTEDMI